MKEIFNFCGVTKTQGYEMANSNSNRTSRHDPNQIEIQGRKKAISLEKIQKMKNLVEIEKIAGGGSDMGKTGDGSGARFF